ncbi:MAG: CoB--CoM heterodisulfide reductase iron-sulfur subunit A family protein [bacterium]
MTGKNRRRNSPRVRIGVFVCHCGTNIGGFLDVPELTRYAKELPGVVFSQENLYTCSDAGLTEIKNGIKEHHLSRVVVAACTPRTHEPLFRTACREAGLNQFLFEFVNIRDQCSWVHMHDGEKATQKAKDLIRMGVAKATLLEPQEEIEVKVNPSALVIGGGIAGMTAALSLANRGFKVRLVEREAQLGGILKDLYKLYPTHEEASKIIGPKIEAVKKNKKIEIFTSSEVHQVRGYVGNYEVVVKKDEEEISFETGIVIVAVGAQVFKPQGRFGYDGKKVITLLELDKMLKEKKFSAKNVVMIQCVGAREKERPYCSRICCTTAIKSGILIKELDPEAKVFILYRDIQTYGAEYEDYYRKAREEGIIFIRYTPKNPPVINKGDLRIYDELLGEEINITYDLVVLSTPLISPGDVDSLSKVLKVPIDENGFFLEAHVKLRPLDFATDGIYACGCAHWPAHVGESVSQAYGAASRASIPLSKGYVKVEPIISRVDEEKCFGCGLCELVCPFKAIRVEATQNGRVAQVVSASCKGCGCCAAGCPQKAISMQHFTDRQILGQVKAIAQV